MSFFSVLIITSVSVGWYRVRYINTSYISDLNIHASLDYSTLLTSSWATPSFQSEEFMFEVETYGTGNPFYENATISTEHYGLGTTDWFKENASAWGEWGYSFNHLIDGAIDGAGMVHYGGYPSPPSSKLEAYLQMRKYVLEMIPQFNNNARPWISFNGHYPFHHYAAEFGFDVIGTEIGENMDSYQMLMAFNRGAARQYGLPWFVDISAWFGAGITEYNDPLIFTEFGGPDNGHSMELYRRTYFMSYMAGASRVIAEGGNMNYFYRTNPASPEGIMDLTPLGEVGQEFCQIAWTHPNRGIAFNPIGIVIDDLHGTPGFANTGIFSSHKAFNTLPFTAGDQMTFDLLEMLFPGGWSNVDTETGALVNNEFGDIFDILLQNASIAVLKCYPALVLSGDIHLNSNQRVNLVDYVEQGGTLIVNSAYVDQLNSELDSRKNDCQLKYSMAQPPKIIPLDPDSDQSGSFIVYGSDYDPSMLLPIFREVLSKITPFEVQTSTPAKINMDIWGNERDIQSLINRNENGWILTLINNDGVSKTHHDPVQLDVKETKNVTVSLNSEFFASNGQTQEVSSIQEWIGGQFFTDQYLNKGEISFLMEPGEVRILEFQF